MGRVQLRIERVAPLALVGRAMHVWNVTVRAAGQPPIERLMLPGARHVSIELAPGCYRAELRCGTGGTLPPWLPRPGIAFAAFGWLLRRVLGDDVWLVDLACFEVGDEQVEPVDVVLSGDGGTVMQRFWQRVAFVTTQVVVGAVLAGLVALLLLGVAELDSAARLLIGGVVAVLCTVSSLLALLVALSHLQHSSEQPPPSDARWDLGIAVFGDVVVGVGLLTLACAAMTCVLVDLQDRLGLQFTVDDNVVTIGTGEVFTGLLWFAAGTLPLVDPQKAWNWDAPWAIESGSPWSWLAGIGPFVIQGLVAIGLARVVTKLLIDK